MQATKPISSSSSSSSSSASKKQCNSNDRPSYANKSQQVASSSKDTQGKSVAQRVMDVTTTTSATTATTATTTTTTIIATSKPNEHMTKSKLQNPGVSSSPEAPEQQEVVERLASRAAKLDISPGVSSASSSNNINAANLALSQEAATTQQQQQKQKQQVLQQQNSKSKQLIEGNLSTSSSSSLLLLPNSIGSSSSQTTQTTSNQQHPAQRPAPLAKTSHPEPTRISLETKVPHPLECAAGLFQAATAPFKDDEVSYYNDAQLERQKQEYQMLLEPKRVGGSLDNSAKPKLLLAASVSSMGARSHDPPTQLASCHQEPARHNYLGPLSSAQGNYQNDESTYEHNYMTADDYDDVYEHQQRYDNALVMEKGQQQQQQHQFNQAGQHLHQRDPSSGYSRYQEISSPPPCELPQVPHTSSSSPTQLPNCQRTVTISTSPKAKSAPATPCNVTPTAFHQNLNRNHQHHSHRQPTDRHDAHLNPNLANTLPPDIRKNISATCRVLPSSMGLPRSVRGGGGGGGGAANGGGQQSAPSSGAQNATNLKYLENLMKSGELALVEKNYNSAISLFSECITLATSSQNVLYLKRNFKIYSQRAEAHYQVANYREAIEDSIRARELNPKWTQAYYLQGRSLLMIGEFARSLAVFSFGLTQEPSNEPLFAALVEAALNSRSSFKQDFELKYNKLKSLHMERHPFLIVSILGQVLLAKGHSEHAAIILESALKLAGGSGSSTVVGNSDSSAPTAQTSGELSAQSKRFKSSVLSTISLAYCTLRDYDKAICYMNKELDIEQELEDINGQCRVLSNLGFAYYKARKFDKSLEAHRKQLNLAMRTHLFPQASQALTAIGHVHVAKCDYSNALTSHTRCLDILKQLGDDCYSQFREMLSIGHMHAMLNDHETAEEKYKEANQLLKQNQQASEQAGDRDDFTRGSIMVQFDLAHLALRRQAYAKAKQHYSSVLELAQARASSSQGSSSRSCTSSSSLLKKWTSYEMRACHGLGQTCRLMKKLDEARQWFEKQHQLAKILKDQVGQSQALCNLGMIQQHLAQDHQEAWRLFDENLKLVDNNQLLKAYAHSYLGGVYQSMGRLKESREHYEISLQLFKELGYCHAEQKTIDDNLSWLQQRQRQAICAEVVNPSPLSSALAASHTEVRSPQTAAAMTTHHKKVMMAS